MTRAHPSPAVQIDDAAQVPDRIAADIEAEARVVFARGGSFRIAVPGGSVAERCFPRIARLAIDWAKLDVCWVDERAVPPSSPDSNYAAARASWLEPAGVPAARVHRMRAEMPDLDAAARAYADELGAVAGTPPRLDYVLLGVGPDGHMASLFPGHPALEDARTVIAIVDAPKPPPRRLSLGLGALTSAARVAIVAFGKDKAPVIREAIRDAGSTLPVARVARAAARCTFVLDRDAGALL